MSFQLNYTTHREGDELVVRLVWEGKLQLVTLPTRPLLAGLPLQPLPLQDLAKCHIFACTETQQGEECRSNLPTDWSVQEKSSCARPTTTW